MAKFLRRKSARIWQCQSKRRDWTFFVLAKLKQQRWNSGVNQSTWKRRWKSWHKFRSTFHTQTGCPYWRYFSGAFVCNLWFSLIVRHLCCSPTFSLAPQSPPHCFHSIIATAADIFNWTDNWKCFWKFRGVVRLLSLWLRHQLVRLSASFRNKSCKRLGSRPTRSIKPCYTNPTIK